ncbi:exodeoxyribonuclease III [Patescibacteria group bacterium]|nr:exodeoxyribonuclease III [Patescibacteria group bacterium]
MVNMRIISWNTNGLRATAKQGFFNPLFNKYQPDILCLQETKAEPEQLPENIKNMPGYYSYFSHSKIKKGYSGVAIYSKEKPEEVFYGMGIKKFDDEGRLLGVKYKNLTLITVYFPNGGMGPDRLKYKLEFYDAFLKFVLKLRKNGEHIIFCGDINTAHKAIDLFHPKENEDHTGFLPIERAWIDKIIKNNFIDVFRKFYPNKTGAYTYWDLKSYARDRNVGWRLDYFFADKYFFDNKPRRPEGSGSRPKSVGIKSTGIMDDYYGSDHCPIWMEIEN